jgi:hypothetical protein
MKQGFRAGFLILGGALFAASFVPELAFAYEFEAQTNALTSSLVTTLLPILSTLGLVYAAALAMSGDASAKSRMVTVVICSIVGFLAPHFIEWLKAVAGQ